MRDKIIDKVFLYYLDRNDSDEEVRDFYLKLKEKLKRSVVLPKRKLSVAEKTLLKDEN
tara:strand:- start:7374 stop:7547 length:174 start_codon:yes stop_codon:yes gene_type:complete